MTDTLHWVTPLCGCSVVCGSETVRVSSPVQSAGICSQAVSHSVGHNVAQPGSEVMLQKPRTHRGDTWSPGTFYYFRFLKDFNKSSTFTNDALILYRSVWCSCNVWIWVNVLLTEAPVSIRKDKRLCWRRIKTSHNLATPKTVSFNHLPASSRVKGQGQQL